MSSERRQEIEAELEKQYELRTEYDRKIGLEGDPRQREAFKQNQTEVARRIQELESELDQLPQPVTAAFFRRNYVNLVDMARELVGRETEQNKLGEMLANGGCLAILGVGGQGKTSLAYNYLKPFLSNPGQFVTAIWLTIEGNGTDLTGLAERLDLKPASNPNETAEAVREQLSSHSTLVILDNFEAAIREDGTLPLDVAALLQRLAEFRGKSQIIITTREIPKGYRLKVLALDGLTPEAGADLLAEQGLGEEARSQLVLASQKARGNPFALKLLADLATDPFTGDTLDNMLQQGDLWDKELAERLLGKMWDSRLTDQERRLLQVLAILRPPARRATLLNLLAPTNDVQLRELLGKLANKSLLSAEYDVTDPKKLLGYDLHPLFRRFIQTEQLSQQSAVELHQAAVSYFQSLIPTLPPKEGYHRKSLNDVWPILEAVYHLNILQNYQAAHELYFVEDLHEALDRWGYATLLLEIYGEWLSSPGIIKRKFNSLKDEGIILGNLGIALYRLGNIETATDYYKQALILARQAGDKENEARRLGNLGSAYRSVGKLEEATNHYTQGLAISREIGDRWGESVHLSNLGSVKLVQGAPQEAFGYIEQALVIVRELGDKSREGNYLGSLAAAYKGLGRFQEAINYCQQSIRINRSAGDKRGEGIRLAQLASVYKEQGDNILALAYWRRAIEILALAGIPSHKEIQHSLEKLGQELGEEAFAKAWAKSEAEYQKLKAEFARE